MSPYATSSTFKKSLALHVLTDREWSRGRATLDIARAAIAGGATVIQLRDKTADVRTLVEEGLALRQLTREEGVLFIVNDRIDIALAVDADGVHVGQEDMPGELARKILGPDRILGISAGNMEEAVTAVVAGADYLGLGPIYTTQSKADAGLPVGLQFISEVAKRYTTPLVAIGGITTENARDVIHAGATGVAVITAVVNATDVAVATRALLHAITAP